MRFAIGLAALALLAQETTIRTTVPLITVPVEVTDAKGTPLSGLAESDFTLLDDGQPRPVHVDVVDSGLAPVALVTLVQTSEMSLAALAKIKKVGAMIPLAVVGANGSAAVLTYNDDIKVAQNFTGDSAALSEAFSNFKPADSDGGRVLDALDQALDMLAALPGAHRANILIIGETRDRGSKQKLEELIPKIQRTGATMYTLSYSKLLTPYTMKADEYQPTGGGLFTGLVELGRLSKRNAFKTLTEATGGEQFRFEVKAKLENDLMRLGKDIHNRYLLSFTPITEDPSRFHRLSIQVKGNPDAVVRARPGYWSMSSTPAN